VCDSALGGLRLFSAREVPDYHSYLEYLLYTRYKDDEECPCNFLPSAEKEPVVS
jgi:hypothetical protein